MDQRHGLSVKMVTEQSSRNRLIFLSVFLLIAFISAINIFPKGYVFSGGDIIQYINLKNDFGHFFYVWNSASNFGGVLQNFSYLIFYIPFYLLSLINISQSSQSFLFFFIFLSSSYISFFVATKRFTNHNFSRTFELRILFSIIYAINPYTLYVFTYTWGYSPFLILYPLLPIIFGLTYSYFIDKKVFNKKLLGLGVVFFLSNIAFGNFAFCVSLILFTILFLLFMFIFKLNKGRVLYKLIAYTSIFFAATMWTIVPIIEATSYGFSYMMSSGSTFNLGVWILYQRTSILTQFFMVPNVAYFVSNFSFLFILGSIAFLSLLFLSFKKITKLSLSFLLLALISIFITAKGQGIISNNLAVEIFSLPILNTLRSPDKTLVFLPFFFLIIIYIGLRDVYSDTNGIKPHKPTKMYLKLNRLVKAHIRKIVFTCFILIIVGTYPFFVGGIQSRDSVSFSGGTNYLTSNNSYLVQVPTDYYDAAKILSQDGRQDKILDLPYSVINSVGWVNYPSWKVIGVDPTPQLFSKPSIEANDANTPFWQEWNNAPNNSTWIIKLMSLFNVQYLIYHKDVASQFINQTQDKINYLQDQGYISLIHNYSDFDLYNLSSPYFLPHIYLSSNITLVQGSSTQLLSSINSSNTTVNNSFFVSSTTSNSQWNSLLNYNQTFNENNATPQVVFQEINPTNYQVKIENATQPFFLIFSEDYDPQWSAYIDNGALFSNIIANYPAVGVQEANSKTSFTPGDISYLFQKALPNSDHYLVNGYLNAWYIDPSQIASKQNGTFEITLYYQPQSYYYLGLTISGTTLAICVIILIVFSPRFKSLFSFFKKKEFFQR